MDEDDIRLYRNRTPALVAVGFLAAFVVALGYGLYHAIDRDFAPPASPRVVPGGEPEIVPVESLVDLALPESVGENERLVANQTVVIRLATGNGHDRYGSGFLYREDVVVSAAHIIGDATGDLHVYCDGIDSPGTIIAFDDIRDVMVLDAPGCPANPLRIDGRRLAADDELHVAGFTFGRSYDIAHRYHRRARPLPGAAFEGERCDPDTTRRLAEMRELRIPRLVGIDTLLIPGNSGSPVYRGDGIVGMVVIRDEPRNRSFIVPAATLRHVLREAGIQ